MGDELHSLVFADHVPGRFGTCTCSRFVSTHYRNVFDYRNRVQVVHAVHVALFRRRHQLWPDRRADAMRRFTTRVIIWLVSQLDFHSA